MSFNLISKSLNAGCVYSSGFEYPFWSMMQYSGASLFCDSTFSGLNSCELYASSACRL